jgi:FKBP-type peptidyl-prolyl cis-trans isomerase FkpA
MIRTFLASIAVALLLSGCLKAKDTGCHFNECEVTAPASEVAAIQTYLTNNGITATQHCSGAFYEIVDPGSGASADACSNVTATYGGFTTTSSTRFDTGTHAFGLGEVIRGWTALIPKVKAGGYIRMYIPPTLGYGNRAVGTIPANSTLIFNVKLESVN